MTVKKLLAFITSQNAKIRRKKLFFKTTQFEYTVKSRKQVELILKCQVLELGLYLRFY